MNFQGWEIFAGLRREFLDTVEMALVFGKQCQSAFLITNDDKVFGIGGNNYGRLGLEQVRSLNMNYIGLPTEIKSLAKRRVKGIVSGGDGNYIVFVVAYFYSGDIYWWGRVPYEDDTIWSPLKIESDLKIQTKVVACGEKHCVILSEDGQVFTFGRNDYGQLGRESEGDNEPSRVEGVIKNHTVTDVSCGYDFSAALLDDGRVVTWGCNRNGQLGVNGFGNNSIYPIEVSSLRGYYDTFIVKIACGRSHILALSKTGTLYAWGSNKHFQLGTKEVPSSKRGCPLEIRVNKLRVTNVAASYLCNISVARCENGKVYHWGETKSGSISEPTEIKCDSMDRVFLAVASPPVMRKPMRRVQSKVDSMEVDSIQPPAVMDPLEQEYNNPDTSDLKIIVDGKEIYVHRATLKMRSEFFNIMITRWLGKKESKSSPSEVTLKEKSFPVVEAYLKYIYSDKLDVDLNLAVELLQLADEYGDNKFKSLCEGIIRRDMTADKVADIFAFTRKLEKCKNLNEFCLNFALLHCTEVIRSPGYQSWDVETMAAFVEEYVKIKGNCR